jgi:hypothetical protein
MPDSEKIDLPGDLRARGFARGDTERMRLVLEALPHLMVPSRRTRRLLSRPYFNEARLLFEIVASASGADIGALASFTADPDAWIEARSATEPRQARPVGEAGVPGRRRRRGRRGGRARRRRRNARAAVGVAAVPHNGEAHAGHAGADAPAAQGGESARQAGSPESPVIECAAADSTDSGQRPRG